jgi:hypothetical protein
MLFHTWPFFVFLAIVLPGFFALRNTRLWLPWLTLASYFFYGWWNPYTCAWSYIPPCWISGWWRLWIIARSKTARWT